MRGRLRRWLKLSGQLGLPILLIVLVGVLASLAFRPWRKLLPSPEELPRTAVRRMDMRVTLRAGGRVESAKRTLIECELENLQIRSQGREMNVGGSAVILSLIPEGSFVKKGDVLCQLDASEYEELVRQQQIKVEEARASHQQADLVYQVALLSVREYRDGNVAQVTKDYEGRIALAKSDLQRAIDRVDWSTRMFGKGYSSSAQLATDKTNVQRCRFNLETLVGLFELFRQHEAPTTLLGLENDVLGSRSILEYQTARHQRFEDRLKHYKRQVDVCTVRAPHDGFVIYANNDRDPGPRIEEGGWVRQKQIMFYLPDLADMEVQATIHETVVDRIHDGMVARVQIEALPGRMIEGHVISVSQVPMWNFVSNDVKNYLGRVKLDSLPGGLRPGMTAEVEIVTANHPDALVVPSGAISYEGGHEVCYVAGQEGVERRQVTVGSSTSEMVEVTAGLAEGEEVVLDPARSNLAQMADSDGHGHIDSNAIHTHDELPTGTSDDN